jgi:hypothetical protein
MLPLLAEVTRLAPIRMLVALATRSMRTSAITLVIDHFASRAPILTSAGTT